MAKTGTVPGVNLPAISTVLARQGDVVAAYLFGSLARGQAGPLSDIDIAALLTPALEEQAAVERQLDLMVALDALDPREMQVTLLNHAPPALAYQVLRDGILFYERSQPQRIGFEVRAMQRYFDVQPMLDFHAQVLMQQIQEVGLARRRDRDTRALEAAERIQQRLEAMAGR
ncbi:MAG: nucleotidyltransferase domain-containing protein [Anaerolineae bacterium]|nr:nucleotidyltransferase domain-containing protein [Anaerolineae bacterium]